MQNVYNMSFVWFIAQVGIPRYQVGDIVRVMDDLAEVAKLQKNHGGWVEEMSDVSHTR